MRSGSAGIPELLQRCKEVCLQHAERSGGCALVLAAERRRLAGRVHGGLRRERPCRVHARSKVDHPGAAAQASAVRCLRTGWLAAPERSPGPPQARPTCDAAARPALASAHHGGHQTGVERVPGGACTYAQPCGYRVRVGAQARRRRAREHLLAVQAADGCDLGRVRGEQHGLGAQRLARGVHQVAQVRLVVEAAEAVLVLNLRGGGLSLALSEP